MTTIRNRLDYDILIVGAGIAGLVSAVQAAGQGLRTLLVTKGKLAGGASYFPKKASLGIQVTAGAGDVDTFREDIERVAQGMNDPRIVDAYIDDSPHKIGLLEKIGFNPWLRGDQRPACFAQYPRDIFMISDWSGASQNARSIVAHNELIAPFEHTTLVRLLTARGRITGAVIARDGEYLLVRCRAVVLATGGIGSLYQHNLYPNHLYGGGHAAALDAGCELVNMEYVQFIPGLLTPKYKVLFGEHTLKYCTGMYDRNGRDLFADMPQFAAREIFAERSAYAPFSFDYTSRVFDIRMMDAIRAGSNGVRLTFSPALYEDRTEFYTIYLNWLKHEMGIDMCADEICVAPFAHSSNGGIRIDEHGETAVKGLFAVGEVASAIEGANRLGGNSVGGSLVFADRAIARAVVHLQSHEAEIRPTFDAMEREFGAWSAQFSAESSVTARDVFRELREILWINANVVREHASLTASLARIEALQAAYSPLVHGFDAYHALTVAAVMLQTMRGRTESRGAHFRADFAAMDTHAYRQIVSAEAGTIRLTRA